MPKEQLCSNESQLNEIFCWSWLSLLLILQSNVIDVFCIFWCFKDINRATEEARHMLSNQAYINRKRYVRMFYSKNKNYNTYNSIPCIIIFRDNGITIQILNYQVYAELSIFLGLIIARLLPIQKNMAQNIVRLCATFAIFVIQPLFYLNGDVNFRKRVKDQGLWKALKRELFQSNSHIQPVPWFKPIYYTCICFALKILRSHIWRFMRNKNPDYCMFVNTRFQVCFFNFLNWSLLNSTVMTIFRLPLYFSFKSRIIAKNL